MTEPARADRGTTTFEQRSTTRPWKMAFPILRNQEPNFEQMEFACVEGNQDLEHYTEDQGGQAKQVRR